MANMSHCRFQNTLGDFQDCAEDFHRRDLSEDEERARAELLYAMLDVIDNFGIDIDRSKFPAWLVAGIDA